MKKELVMSLGLALSCLACSKYDDSALYNLIAKLDQRLVAVEEHVKKANEDIKTLKDLVSAASQGKTITEVKKTDEGYDLTFSDKQVISIKMGRDGMDGHSPKISVALDGGVYYWQLDGKWLLDTQGQKVRVSGETGPQGIPGKDGKTPKLRINAGKWEVAYGNNDWIPVMVVSSGTSGATTVEGLDLFKNIKETDKEVVITLKSGGTIKLSKQTSTPSNPLQPGEVISNPNNPFNGKNIVSDEISTDNYILSYDGLDLIKWKNTSTRNLDMNSDSQFSKITFIGDYAFEKCQNLKNVHIVSSVTRIGRWAFKDCRSLTNINIPNSVTSIGQGTFYGCDNLTSITIPNSVTSIETSAFELCSSLKSATIPSSVTSIGENAFWACSNLTSINIPSSVTSIGKKAFAGCRSLTSIHIPSSVTRIGESVFGDCINLTSINIPSSVTSIGREAFGGCSNLTSINIPSSVTSIGDRAFSFCSNLTSINIPSSVTSIGEKAFAGCRSLTSIHIPSSVTRIGESTFRDCERLTSINIPSSITSIGEYAFAVCSNLTSINIPSSVTRIGESAFWACSNLTSVVFKGNNPPKIADSASKVFEYTPSSLRFIVPKGAKSAYIKAGYPVDKIVEQ